MKLRSRIVQDSQTRLPKYKDRGPCSHLTCLSLWTGEEAKCQKKEAYRTQLHSQLSEQILELLCALHREKHNNLSSMDRKAQLNNLLCRGTNPPSGISLPQWAKLQAPECIRLSLMPSMSYQAAEEKIAHLHHLDLGGWCVICTACTNKPSIMLLEGSQEAASHHSVPMSNPGVLFLRCPGCNTRSAYVLFPGLLTNG